MWERGMGRKWARKCEWKGSPQNDARTVERGMNRKKVAENRKVKTITGERSI
jgi:hypothetical protein